MSKHAKPVLPTATHPLIGWAGFAAMCALMGYVLAQDTVNGPLKSLTLVGGTAFVMILIDMVFFKVYRRESTGLNWVRWNFNPLRIVFKYLGFILTLLALGGIYYVLPVYNTPYFFIFWNTVFSLLPYGIVFALIYIPFVDGWMTKPEDGYYNAGLVASGEWKKIDRSILGNHMRSWLIKGFFIPLMFIFLTGNVNGLQNNFNAPWMSEPIAFFSFALFLLYTTDLVFALVGYVFSMRLTDTQERSCEPTFLGWFVAIACYPPFNNFFNTYYLKYGSEDNWEHFFADNQPLLIVWGSIIVLLIGFYTWATVVFGCRFSNLTHRGIITHGPYKFTKHPAYIAKNISWWLMFMPFVTMGSPVQCLSACIMLLLMNGFYVMRAWTEERHLARDQAYREYQDWIAVHGIFRWFPFKMHAKPLPIQPNG